MTTSDYALIVSIFAVLISLASFIWNVWSKFIYPTGKVRVRFFVAVVVMGQGERAQDWPHYVTLSATNYGPTEVELQSVHIIIRPRHWWQRGQRALVNPIHDVFGNEGAPRGPFAGGLPKKLGVGDSHTAYFPYVGDSFARLKLRRVGFYDNSTVGTPARAVRSEK